MPKLKEIASMIMDLYNQEVLEDDQYFDLDDFIFQTASAYGKVLLDKYEMKKQENRAETGSSMVEVSPEWLRTETIDLKPEGDCLIACLNFSVFSWPFDSMDTGIQSISAIGCQCDEFVKISPSDTWQLKLMPETSKIMYYRYGQQVNFVRNNRCKMDKARIVYVPAPTSADGEMEISQSLVYLITTVGVQLMLAAKQNNPAKTTNDSNPNKVEQFDTNEDRLK
jgi:hypothetical protein